MQLKYFSLQDTQELLKTKYKKLALLHHPDRNLGNEAKATAIMQDIHAELEYCLKNNGQMEMGMGGIDITRVSHMEYVKNYAKNFMQSIIDEEKNPSMKTFMGQLKNQMFESFDRIRNGRPTVIREDTPGN